MYFIEEIDGSYGVVLSRVSKQINLAQGIAFSTGFVYLILQAFRKRPENRFYYYMLSQVHAIMSCCYFLLSDHALVLQAHDGHLIYLPRYMEWVLTFPLILTMLTYPTGLDIMNVYMINFFSVMMILTGLFAEMTTQFVRWVFFTLSCICYIPILIFMYKDFDKDTIKEMQGIVTGHTAWYSTLVKLFFTPLFVYPVVFGLAVTRTIGPPLDNIFYSILDTIVKMGVTVVVFKAVGLNHTSTITPHLDSFIDPLQINTTTDDIQMMVDTMTENDDDADRIKEKSVVDL